MVPRVIETTLELKEPSKMTSTLIPTSEMTSAPAWTPGKYLSRGDSSVIDIAHPVSDPIRCVRHPTGYNVPSDLLYMPMKSKTSSFPLSASTVLVLAFLGIIGVASFTLFTYTHS